MTARRGVRDSPLAGLKQKTPSVKLAADDFSLRERGISLNGLVERVSVSNVDSLVDLPVKDGAKIVWH